MAGLPLGGKISLNNNGVNSYVDINQNIDLGSTNSDFTFGCALKIFNPSAPSYETIFSNYQASRPRMSLYIGAANGFNLYIEESTHTYHCANNTAITSAQQSIGSKLFLLFDHIGLSTTTAKIYINGVDMGVRTVASRDTLATAQPFTQTGFRFYVENTGTPLLRNMDFFYILKKSGGLSSLEQSNLYNSGFPVDPRTVSTLTSSVYRFWKFDNIYDVAGNSYTSGSAYVKEEITNTYNPLVNFTAPYTTIY